MLDIGSGSGLLSLMLAQRYDCPIDAVEIDAETASEAEINIANSPWKNRIHLYNEDVRTFSQQGNKKYDLIVSNPPFYSNHLKSGEKKKNIARHQMTLSLEELAEVIRLTISDHGIAYVLLPPEEMAKLETAMDNKGFNLCKKLLIHNFQHTKPIANISTFSFQQNKCSEENLVIWSKPGTYTQEFRELLQDYFLIF